MKFYSADLSGFGYVVLGNPVKRVFEWEEYKPLRVPATQLTLVDAPRPWPIGFYFKLRPVCKK